MTDPQQLSRRERQIIDVLYALETEAAVADVQGHLPGNPSYSTVRAQLNTLLAKGHVQHRRCGNRYLYRPSVDKATASQGAARRLINTFFSGSPTDAVLGLLGEADEIDADELAAIEVVLDQLRDKQKGERQP
ncbi:MAG: BlaI/MecI/CopY family transcriptional regulator [Pseudomonadaceae bacterium]|nr:BlaI/MecI/CopY family transcriptional regulator [Pseudomonadaceae bacterium]